MISVVFLSVCLWVELESMSKCSCLSSEVSVIGRPLSPRRRVVIDVMALLGPMLTRFLVCGISFERDLFRLRFLCGSSSSFGRSMSSSV